MFLSARWYTQPQTAVTMNLIHMFNGLAGARNCGSAHKKTVGRLRGSVFTLWFFCSVKTQTVNRISCRPHASVLTYWYIFQRGKNKDEHITGYLRMTKKIPYRSSRYDTLKVCVYWMHYLISPKQFIILCRSLI